MAIALAVVMFGESALKVSYVTGDHGRLQALNEVKMLEIERIITVIYEIKWTILTNCGNLAKCYN